ncbi:MAG TPA: 50S ribosomal protein L10 [Anaerolineae bacterium]|mgnify:FL=1|nr:50S ribosomal protein L10 [Anaerolineae bacterium]
MAITREKKEQYVEAYVEQLAKSPAIVLTEYRGTTVQQIQRLRGQMREHNAGVQVVKNSLMAIALRQAGLPAPQEYLVGPTAVVYLPEDVATAAKALFDSIKDLDKIKVRGAILDGQVLDAEGARKLRELPSKNEVRAQLLGVIQGPASELVRTLEAPANELYRTLQAPLRELALTIQSYADKGAQANA